MAGGRSGIQKWNSRQSGGAGSASSRVYFLSVNNVSMAIEIRGQSHFVFGLRGRGEKYGALPIRPRSGKKWSASGRARQEDGGAFSPSGNYSRRRPAFRRSLF